MRGFLGVPVGLPATPFGSSLTAPLVSPTGCQTSTCVRRLISGAPHVVGIGVALDVVSS